MNRKTSFVAVGVTCLLSVGLAWVKAYDKMAKPSDETLLMANVEALADDADKGCNNKNGYREWKISGGIFSSEKEFYDCCSVLRHGYSPSGNCN